MSSASLSEPTQCGVDNLEGLPGAEIVRLGIKDLLARRATISSCLVAVALPRLQACGVVPCDFKPHFQQSELLLYRILLKQSGDAYSRYNALLRELVSFERALSARSRNVERIK